MQQLILLRHAKSDWSVGDGTDFSRPLAPRGERELPVIASALKPYLAGRISCLCSPAMRTRQTFDIGAPYWPDIKLSMKKASIMPRSGYCYILLKGQKRQQIRCLLLAIIPASASFCTP